MSKKLIAVASAAALALTALVGVAPASASPTITYVGAASGAGLTAAAPIVINVPSQNVLRDAGGTSATTSGSVIRVDIDSPLTNQTIRVTSTGAVKLLTTAQFSVSTNRTSAFGAQSLDLVSTEADGFAGFYVYTTSTAVGTFSVTDAGTTIVRHIEGANTVAYAYNVDFTAPTTADVSGSIKLTGSITDIFGNKIEGLTAAQTVDNNGTLTVTRFGAAGALSTVAADVWTESKTAKGTYTFSVLTTAAAGTGVIGLNIPVQTVTGFTPKNTALFTFTTASLADQVKTLQASITTLQATVAALTVDYNRLATRFNKRYDLQKAPVKKVSLK
jgi:hypothetical protein